MHMRRKGRKGMKRTVGRFYVGGKEIRVVQVPGMGSVELTSTYNHHHRPPHSASCQSARTVFVRVGGCKHHQRKLQRVILLSALVSPPVQRRKTPQVHDAKASMQGPKVRRQSAKVRASISVIQFWMQQQHATIQPSPAATR